MVDFDPRAVRQDFHLVIMRGRVFFEIHRDRDDVVRLYARWGNYGFLQEQNRGINSLRHLLFWLVREICG
jgi:hypothetical protein